MADMNVTYEEMEQAATRLETGESDMNTKLTELQTFIQNLVTNGFVTDTASVSFEQAYNEFTTSTRTGLQALTSMGTYLRTASTRLKETDQSLTVSYA
jgi:WXG100 family type VII secretion target